MADFMAGMDPFLIFPEEVWELILDQVEDSQDAWNLLKAFPQLDANLALQKKKHFWLFGLVIPHLLPFKESSWIKEQDLLNCRQVCVKWSTAVDGFLESQPQLRGYHPESQGQLPPGQFHWNVKAYLDDEFRKVHLGGTGFDVFTFREPTMPAARTPRQFLDDMEAHPPARNPFLSRALTIYPWDAGRGDLDAESVEFAKDVFALRRKFGKHVWFYRVNFIWNRLGARSMREGIACLPNLKMLHFEVTNRDWEAVPLGTAKANKFLKQLEKNLPALPLLETLKIGKCPGQLSHCLISRFAPQIRRLDLHIYVWRDEYSKLFPNLTEFNITVRRLLPDELKNVLLQLEAPHLSKLHVKFPDVFISSPFVIEDDGFQWLKRFPNMKFLDLGYDRGGTHMHFIEKGTLDPAKDSISSLQFLAIHTSFQMNFNFLRCFPSLQHLQLHVSSNLSTYPSVRIREEIPTASMYKSNIWEILPKLRSIDLIVGREGTGLHAFRRERYEFESRLNNRPAVGSGGNDDALAPLREDIVKFLQASHLREMGLDQEDEEEINLDGDMNLEDNSDDEDDDDVEGGEDDDDGDEIDEGSGEDNDEDEKSAKGEDREHANE